MARIETARPKTISGGFFRLIGDRKLSGFLSKVMSANITQSNELKKMIKKTKNRVENLDFFLRQHPNYTKQTVLVDQKQIKNSKIIKKIPNESFTPDFLVFKGKSCYIVYLTDGAYFDTKRSKTISNLITNFKRVNNPNIDYTMIIQICCFNHINRQEIIKSFNKDITIRDALTGENFCKLIGMNYEKIKNSRLKDTKENLNFFKKEVIKILKLKGE